MSWLDLVGGAVLKVKVEGITIQLAIPFDGAPCQEK